MALDTIFVAAGIIIIFGFISEMFFDKTGIPDVLWLILIGVLIGPVLGFIAPDSIGTAASIFTSFALLFILFEGGLHIRIRDLMKSMWGATSITLVNFVLTVFVITFISVYFGMTWINAILMGTILGGTSAAVVVPIVRKLKMSESNRLVLILESAFTDVLCIVSALTIIQIIQIGNANLSSVLNVLFGAFAIAIFVGGIAGFAWILFLEKFAALTKSYILTIGVLLVIYGLTEFSKSSGAIAGLTFGIVLGNSRKILSLTEHKDEDALTASARLFFSQISFFVKTFFFVYIGILISFTAVKPIMFALIITAAIFLLRPIAVRVAYREENVATDKPFMEGMVPKGLAAAVLAQIPIQQGIPGGERFLTPVVATIFFSILVTTVMIYFIQKGSFPGTSYYYNKLRTMLRPQTAQIVTAQKESVSKLTKKKP